MADSQGNDAQNGAPQGQYAGPRAIDPVSEHSHDDDPDFITRTRFLSGVAVAGGVVLTAAILVPIVGFAVTDAVKTPADQWVDIGPMTSFPDGQMTSIAVSGLSRMVGRTGVPPQQGRSDDRDLESLRAPGLPGRVLQGRRQLRLPVPRRRVQLLGLVTAGPPPRPLDRFNVKVVNQSGQTVGSTGTVHGSW